MHRGAPEGLGVQTQQLVTLSGALFGVLLVPGQLPLLSFLGSGVQHHERVHERVPVLVVLDLHKGDEGRGRRKSRNS